ncbi:MAG TPA: hypothetical protein PKK48_09705 [Phycisphaerae bacterium]|nr:hypothetical protein [Phycisphaerae bacterium]HPS53488.1 hypothetical protein [Phycisphaerae bacterium]
MAAAEDGAVVPLSELKKSVILKKTPAAEQTGQPSTAASSSNDDESKPSPAIPELPSSSGGEIPAVPEMPSDNELQTLPSGPAASTTTKVMPKSTPQIETEGFFDDESSLPAPMGPTTASKMDMRDMFGKKTIPVTMSRDRRIIHSDMHQLNALPENASVIAQPGKIYKGSDGWYWVRYEASHGKTPRAQQRLLPCRILQSVEEQLAVKPDTLFDIYGQAMLYDGMTYLLLRRVTIEDGNSQRIEDASVKNVQDEEPDLLRPTGKSLQQTTVASVNTATTVEKSSSAAEAISKTDDLLAGMMSETEGRAIRTTNAPSRSAEENKTSVAPAGQMPLTQGRENLVIDRLARVVKSKHSDWYEVHFISDNTLREPPYLVLPNSRLTESLRLNSYLGYHDRKLRISGEVIFYKGRRYILLTKVFPERDMRQF